MKNKKMNKPKMAKKESGNGVKKLNDQELIKKGYKSMKADCGLGKPDMAKK